MIRYFIILFLINALCSCNTTDSKEILKSILNIDDLSGYNYKILYVKDFYTEYPYTIYFKIDIDSTYYEKLKIDKIDNCVDRFKYSEFFFESQKVSMKNYEEFKEEDIPEWFDIPKTEIDIWAFYDVDSLRINKCDEGFNAWVFLQYSDGNCYLILDSVPQPRLK